MRKGAKGYGNAVMSTPVLRQAVGVIQSGNLWVYPELMQRLISVIPSKPKAVEIKELTERETEIAMLVADGLSNKIIADRLGVAEITVKKKILSSVYSKLNLKDRLGLAIYINKASGNDK